MALAALIIVDTAITIADMINLYTSRKNQTVILTNYMTLTKKELESFGKAVGDDKLSKYFVINELEKGTNKFKCTVKPYTGDDEETDTGIGNTPVDCEIFSADTQFGKIIRTILNILRIVGIALFVLLGAADFVKALVTSDADDLKKAGGTFVKRLIIIVLIFFAPIIIDLLFNIIDSAACSSTSL